MKPDLFMFEAQDMDPDDFRLAERECGRYRDLYFGDALIFQDATTTSGAAFAIGLTAEAEQAVTDRIEVWMKRAEARRQKAKTDISAAIMEALGKTEA